MLNIEEIFESTSEVIETPTVGSKYPGYSDQGWARD